MEGKTALGKGRKEKGRQYLKGMDGTADCTKEWGREREKGNEGISPGILTLVKKHVKGRKQQKFETKVANSES